MKKEVNNFKERLASVLDIRLPELQFDKIFDHIYQLMSKSNLKKQSREEIKHLLEQVHDTLLQILNKETNAYLKHIKLNLLDYA